MGAVDWMVQADAATLGPLVHLIPLVVFQFTLDGANCLCQGILWGLGYRTSGAIGILVFGWGVRVPAAWCLCFRAHLGVVGIWYGVPGISDVSFSQCGCLDLEPSPDTPNCRVADSHV